MISTATTSNTNFIFKVTDVEVKDEESLTDVIKTVNYTYDGVFDDGGSMLSHQVTGSFNCTDASSSDFIGFSRFFLHFPRFSRIFSDFLRFSQIF